MGDMRGQHFVSWDERRDIAHPGDRSETVTFCVEHFINCAKEAIRDHKYFSVALAGGSTPKEIFQKLSSTPYLGAVDWHRVLLFWGDERNVTPTNLKSNFCSAMNAGLKSLSIPPHHVFRMQAERDIEENAKAYDATIRKILQGRPFDLVMLGMGEDGHTASLFPKTSALKETKSWVVANKVPQKRTCRMTLTYPCINYADNIVIYVLGSSKSKMVKKVFLEKHNPPFPVDLIGTSHNKALWVCDTEAGKQILENLKRRTLRNGHKLGDDPDHNLSKNHSKLL